MKIIQGEIENLSISIENLNHPEKNQVISELTCLQKKSQETSITMEIIDHLNLITKQCKTLIEQENQYNQIKNNLKLKENQLIDAFIITVEENSNLTLNIEVNTIIEEINQGNLDPLKAFIQNGKLQHYNKHNKKIQKLLEKLTKAENKSLKTNPSEILVETHESTFKLEDFIETQVIFSRDKKEKSTTIQKSTPNNKSNFLSSKFKWLAGLAFSVCASTFMIENIKESNLSSSDQYSNPPKHTMTRPNQLQKTGNLNKTGSIRNSYQSSIEVKDLEIIPMGANPNSTQETNITKGLHQIALNMNHNGKELKCNKEFFERIRVTTDILKDLDQLFKPVTTPFRVDEENPLFLLKEQIFWELNDFKSIGDTVCLLKHENIQTNFEKVNVVDALTKEEYSSYQWSTIKLQKNSDTKYQGIATNQIKTIIFNLLSTQEQKNKVSHIKNDNNLMKKTLRNASSTEEILNHPKLEGVIKSLLPSMYNLDVVVTNFEYNNHNSVSIIQNQQSRIIAKILLTFYNCPNNDNDVIIEIIAANPNINLDK
ncbi:hypothetical protein HOJ01_01045 [bacterium]|jgi:hypothetical protein|nr:hypothetical protein [bacterium]MBT6293375.1 hypothetical protein [bacterium]